MESITDKMERQHIMDDTELVKMSENKFRFIHTVKKKVSAKMFDYNCDVKLKVGKEVFEAHRDVLSEASDYFSAMFSHNMKEKEQDAIELKGLSAKGCSQLLEYFYHGHITIVSEYIQDCLEASRFFHIEWLIYVCCYFLIYNTSVENFDSVLLLADQFALDTLKADVFQFIGQNFLQLVEQNKVVDLSHEILDSLLSEDYYIPTPEKVLLSAILDWVEHNKAERKQYAGSLLSKIHYSLMHPNDLESLQPELYKYSEVEKLIKEAQEYLSNPFSQCLFHSKKTSIRGCRPVIALVSAVDDTECVQYKIAGTPGFHSEEINSSGLDTLYEYSVTNVLGNFLYVVGGYNRKCISTRRTYRLDIRFGLWLECASMNEARTSFSLCNDGMTLYSIGGVNHLEDDTEVILNTTERYDPVENEWRLLAALPKRTFENAASTWNGTVYLTGGISEDDLDPMPLDWLYSFDPDQNEWTQKASMLTGRQGHSMNSLNGKLYVFGGHMSGRAPEDEFSPPTFADCFRNEVYDIETDQWTELVATPDRWGHLDKSTAQLDSQIFVVGGKHMNRYLHVFNTETDQWEDPDSEDGEYCGPYIKSVLNLQVAFPFAVC